MGCTCRNGRRRALHNLRGWSINSQRPAIVRAESHRATSKMHHFQPSDVGWVPGRAGLSPHCGPAPFHGALQTPDYIN